MLGFLRIEAPLTLYNRAPRALVPSYIYIHYSCLRLKFVQASGPLCLSIPLVTEILQLAYLDGG